MTIPHIKKIESLNNILSYGVVYDCGDFPTESQFHNLSGYVEEDHVVIFNNLDNFKEFYARVIGLSDLDFIFTSTLEMNDICKKLLAFKASKRSAFSTEIREFLCQNTQSNTYNLYE